MGLPLYNHSSFSLTSGAFAAPAGPSLARDFDTADDLDDPLEDPSSYRVRQHAKHPRQAYHGRPNSHSNSYPNLRRDERERARTNHRLRTARLRQQHTPSPSSIRAAASETHHVKPRNPWAADADEGCALARSLVQLPGESQANIINGNTANSNYRLARQNSRSRSSGSSSSSSPDRRRPPSLERQDAFRDEKTAKRRRVERELTPEWDDHMVVQAQEAEEIAELYRLGLLYDDEHERGAGFSMEQIVREEPVYSVRVRNGRRGRGGGSEIGFRPLEQMAFSVFGEDKALAGWLVGSSAMELDEPKLWNEVSPAAVVRDDAPRLTVIYELADDDGVSDVSADDFLGSISVSDVSSCCGGGKEEEDNEMAWAVLDGYNGINENAALAAGSGEMVDEDGIEPWVVLGLDGS
ncbi:hypothetical protein C8A05DRAFT_48021 [Staphylotrichum tortipilum]|uniref:Uncharacterized protein n=1 Tax=Staphylotrichum tortipilum TaxID=2831512 RepID=A0AAN6MAS4_9PEZI|nr:hypothetical protein C8A05DRAFT_48021 [Staphylotrichum longicolle]